MYRQRRRDNYGVYLLMIQLMSQGFGNIPPVTLCTIIINVAIYLGIFETASKSKICISAFDVFKKHDYKRILTAPLFHSDDMHLYYNMISFVWKGRTLETLLGSSYFAYILTVFAILTTSLYAVMAYILTLITNDISYSYQCALGFSGVIFALKVLTTHYTPPQDTYIMGLISVPSQYAMWAELLLIQFFVPGTSFLGHLAGILVGLAYTKGPLEPLMRVVWNMF